MYPTREQTPGLEVKRHTDKNVPPHISTRTKKSQQIFQEQTTTWEVVWVNCIGFGLIIRQRLASLNEQKNLTRQDLNLRPLFYGIHSSLQQVCKSDGSYFRVPLVEGGILVNVGDLMQRWTSDLYIATVSISASKT